MEIKLKANSPLELKALSPPIKEALFNGCEEEVLVDQIRESEGESGLINFYYYLNLAKQHSLLSYQTPLIRVVPLNEDFTLEPHSDKKWQFSRFALCRFLDGEFVWETPLKAVRVHFLSEDGIRFLSLFSQPRTLKEVQRHCSHLTDQVIEETLKLFISARLLTDEEESLAAQQWEFHDLHFHSRSRAGRHDTPFGGTYRFKEVIPPLPGVKSCPKQPLISLDRPEKELSITLERTLEERKSIRKHGEKPISRKQLGEFLFHTARVKQMKIFEDQEMTSRPYPGGGGRYEFELYPLVQFCEGIEQGVFHYHPVEHALCRVSELNQEAEKLLVDACRASGKEEYPQLLILVSARFQRVSWKYQSMAYAVILKDLGVLFQTMYLVATAMKLAPCALGGGNSDLFCKALGTNYLEETSVGEFMLGSISNS